MLKFPARGWPQAHDAHDAARDGAWVAELTNLLDLSAWPPAMRVIARKERPHPGAQLRITDIDGHRITVFATNTRTGGPRTQLADLELPHRPGMLEVPQPGPLGRPHPHLQGHRATRVPLPRLRRQPDRSLTRFPGQLRLVDHAAVSELSVGPAANPTRRPVAAPSARAGGARIGPAHSLR